MRIIWLLMGGGAVLFLASIVLLVVTHPNTPANALNTFAKSDIDALVMGQYLVSKT